MAKVGSWHGTVCPRCSHCHNASTKRGFELTEPAARLGQPLTACPESQWLCSTAGLVLCGIFFLILAVLQQSRCFAYSRATSCPAWRSYWVVLCNAPGTSCEAKCTGPMQAPAQGCTGSRRGVGASWSWGRLESGLGLLLTRSRVYRGKCSISAGAGIDPGCPPTLHGGSVTHSHFSTLSSLRLGLSWQLLPQAQNFPHRGLCPLLPRWGISVAAACGKVNVPVQTWTRPLPEARVLVLYAVAWQDRNQHA